MKNCLTLLHFEVLNCTILFRVWRETCEAYTAQLTEEGHYTKASTYLLAVNKIEEAIDLLVEQKLFTEAVAIAKCRLPENNPTVGSIYMKWADHATRNGLHQLAAHWYVKIILTLMYIT